jgi:cation transport regulator ChaB
MTYPLEVRMLLWKDWKDYLSNLFQKAMQEDKDIRIRDNEYIRINSADEIDRECFRHKVSYKTLSISGYVYTEDMDDEDFLKKIPFSDAHIDGLHFICDCGSDEQEPYPLLKAFLQHTHPIYDVFLIKSDVRLKDT